EILPPDVRQRVIDELLVLREEFPKLAMPKEALRAFLKPPSDPEHCIFARTTTTITANLKHRVAPCQFGGDPDCSQCGCMATAGLEAVGQDKPPGGVRAGTIYEASLKFGAMVQKLRPMPYMKFSEKQLIES